MSPRLLSPLTGLGLGLAALLGSPAWAQGGPGGPGGPGGGNQDGAVGVAILLPRELRRVQLTATYGDPQDAVVFSDDGTLAVDEAGDGEWWALLELRPNGSEITVVGSANGVPIRQTETLKVPMAWTSTTYPMTFIAVNDGVRYRLERLRSSRRPALEAGERGGGAGSEAAGLGLSVGGLAAIAGLLALTVSAVGVLRARILALPGPSATER